MESFGSNHYVPILFTKAGERDALKEIADDRKSFFTPLFVVHPVDWDFDLDQPKKSIDEHLKKLPAELAKCWPSRAAFVDVLHLDEQTMSDGSHPLEWIVNEAAKVDCQLVPVFSPSRTDACIQAVANLISTGRTTDVCLRLEAEHWPVPPQDNEIDMLLARVGADKSDTHLVIDLRDGTGAASRFALGTALRSLVSPTEWKTLTVTATAMPQTPPSGQGLHEIPRQEWLNYQSLVETGGYGVRVPTYGDYAIGHPDLLDDINPRMLQISAKLKYTCSEQWLVARGALFKGTGGRSEGGEAIRPAARAISAHNDFALGHCRGEDWITAAAAQGPTGSPRTWITVGTSHHVQKVLDQIGLN